MIDQAKASQLKRRAYDEWQAGQHELSRLLYEEAIAFADPQHWALSMYYGEYACVLNHVGRHDEACTQLEKALATEIAQGQTEEAPSVFMGRYFLAQQLRRLGDNERALDTLAPSIAHVPGKWVIRLEEAHILHALDRKADARAAAALAIACAPTTEKAEQLKRDLQEVFGDSGTQA